MTGWMGCGWVLVFYHNVSANAIAGGADWDWANLNA